VTNNVKLDKVLTLPFGDGAGYAPGKRTVKPKSNVKNVVNLSETSFKYVCILIAQKLCI
jgi:hypothetical protein